MRRDLDASNRLPGRRTGDAAALALLLTLAACGHEADVPATAPPTSPPVARPVTALPPAPIVLRFGGFAAAREALRTRVLPAFAQAWNKTQPQRVKIRTLFAGGEDLADALDADFPADVAVLAPPHDFDALRTRGSTAPASRHLPYGGVVCRSLVVLAVRKGNPLGIRDWSDLTRPEVRVTTPDPTESGCGVWNLAAMFGAAMRGHAGVPANDADAARTFIDRVRTNVVASGASAHEAFVTFLGGAGDVAITYESELAQAWMFGHDVERVLPSSTVLVESSAVLLDHNVDRHGTRTVAQALLEHLWTTDAQVLLANCGLRPVDPVAAAGRELQFPLPADLWTIEQLGGWPHVGEQIQRLLTAATAPASPAK